MSDVAMPVGCGHWYPVLSPLSDVCLIHNQAIEAYHEFKEISGEAEVIVMSKKSKRG